MHLFVHLPDSLFRTDTRDAEINETDVHDMFFGQEYMAI